jgi:hypothetical protein
MDHLHDKRIHLMGFVYILIEDGHSPTGSSGKVGSNIWTLQFQFLIITIDIFNKIFTVDPLLKI